MSERGRPTHQRSIAATELKSRVRDHWEREVCGSRYGEEFRADRRRFFAEIERARYHQDYMISELARFEEARGKRVLEMGLGAGTDFVQWIRHGATAYGRDLTTASVEMVKERLALENLAADVGLGDAESLGEFPDNFFDVYYSWGVLHHTPSPERAFAEAHRVLKPGGVLKIMLYHSPSVGVFLVWLVHGPLRFRWIGPRSAYAHHVESPGTRAFSVAQIKATLSRLFHPDSISCRTYLGSGDLLTHRRSTRYAGAHWRLLQAAYPRWFVRRALGDRLGSVLTVEATK